MVEVCLSQVDVEVLGDESDPIYVDIQQDETIEVEISEPSGNANDDYNELRNLPQINDVTIKGKKVGSDYGLFSHSDLATNSDIIKMFK